MRIERATSPDGRKYTESAICDGGQRFPPVEADYTSRFLEEAKCAIPLMESDRRPVAYNADDPAAGQIEHIIRGPKPRRPIKKNGA